MLLAAAAAHLVLVGLGAAHLAVPEAGPAGSIFGVYGAYSGAGTAYGFFAPGVAAEWRAAIDAFDPVTGKWTTTVRTAPNLELSILDTSIAGHFGNENVREALAASWAATALADHPGAAAVAVRAEAYIVPPMKQYRAGARPQWTTLAAYAFTTAERSRLVEAQHAPATR